MKNQLEQRLQTLKVEFESGQKMLTELQAKQASVKETLLRIQGAIQVLEEELAKAEELVKTEEYTSSNVSKANGSEANGSEANGFGDNGSNAETVDMFTHAVPH